MTPVDNTPQKKSPLKFTPLRTAGQSAGQQLNELLYGKIMTWCLMSAMMIGLAVMEWCRWILNKPPTPVFLSILAVAFCGVAWWRVGRQMPLIRQLRLGQQGEKLVGQCLEQLRTKGYQVFHDIPGDGHNIDHAIVGLGGVFAIETKTIRKPAKGLSEIVLNGEKITVNGMTPDRDPVVQVSAAARELARIVKDTTGREVPVRPVLLYPGWYTTQPKGSQVWVLNETAFPKFLDYEPAKLTADDIHAITAGISMHVRNMAD